MDPLILDVRPILAKGGSPCDPIHEALGKLAPGQSFVLIVPFEPVPLYDKLGAQGYTHVSGKMSDGTWRVEFHPDGRTAPAAGGRLAACGVETRPVTKDVIPLDARGLEPPQPMVLAFEALEKLPGCARLALRTDRHPIFLLEELDRRGFHHHSEDQGAEGWLNEIWRAE